MKRLCYACDDPGVHVSMYSPDLNSIFGEIVRLDLNFIFASGLKSKTNLNTEPHCSGKCVWGEINGKIK